MKRNIEVDDLFRLKLLNSPEISPDGEKIAFTYKWTDLKKNTYCSNLYMADLKVNTVYPFTRGEHNDSYPLWSPDGKYIAFRSDRDKKGLWIIPVAGGEAYPLITDKGSIGEYTWSPDSKFIAYTFKENDPLHPREHITNDPDYEIKDEDIPYDIIEDIPYKTKNGVITPKGKYNIYLIDLETKEKTRLTEEKYNDNSLSFSPDGKKLAFCSNRLEDTLHNYENSDIYLLHIQSKELKKITHQWGTKSSLSWTADGKYIYFTGHHAPKGHGGWADLKVYKVPAEGGETILLTHKFPGYVSNMLIGDTREFDDVVQPPAQINGGKDLLFCASYHGGCYLYEVSSGGGESKRIEEGKHEVIYYSIDKSGNNMAVLRGDILHPSEVYHYKKTGNTWDVKRITDYNDFIAEETNITEPEEIWITTTYGVKLQGWLVKPPSFDHAKKYPMIHEVHGGPHILFGYTFFHEFHYFASKGYCVLFINPRGSRGYGEDFTRSIEGNWGVPDKEDHTEFLAHVIEKGYIDDKKMFVVGGSYGGYMTNWLITQTDRYCAAVSLRGVSNCATVFGVSSGNIHFEHTFGGIPWRDAEHYMKHSPLYHVEKVNTPLMILHSENDNLTPICEAEQFFVALRYLGKKVRFVRFRVENHELSRGGKPTNRRARLEVIIGWFNEYRDKAD